MMDMVHCGSGEESVRLVAGHADHHSIRPRQELGGSVHNIEMVVHAVNEYI